MEKPLEIQLVELHYSQPPQFDMAAVKSRAEATLDDELDVSSLSDDGDSYLVVHKDFPVEYSDGEVAPQTAIFAANEPIDIEKYAGDIQQSWGFRDCEPILAESRHTLLVSELMARLLTPVERVRLFHGILQAVVELTRPDAMVFKHSQQVVRPAAYLAAATAEPILRPGSLNVRFFNVTNTDGEMLMDTRGMEEIGLHDLQCHFRDLEPNAVSRLLFNSAVYIFENGPVVESGNTIAGIEPGSKWTCQFETSLINPERELLDVNPGPAHAAGNRN